MNKIKIKIKIILTISLFLFTTFVVNADTSIDIAYQTSLPGLSGREVFISTGTTTKYINKGDDSEIIGNYLSGYYFDKIYGFFQLNYGTGGVMITDSSDKCSSGYGYKLGGKAFSQNVGYIDFAYSSGTYVYYCMDDKKLHGYAYLPSVGYQSFEGIGFEIIPNLQPAIIGTGTRRFVNESTMILNKDNRFVWFLDGDINSVEYGHESTFYIFKPKK